MEEQCLQETNDRAPLLQFCFSFLVFSPKFLEALNHTTLEEATEAVRGEFTVETVIEYWGICFLFREAFLNDFVHQIIS